MPFMSAYIQKVTFHTAADRTEASQQNVCSCYSLSYITATSSSRSSQFTCSRPYQTPHKYLRGSSSSQQIHDAKKEKELETQLEINVLFGNASHSWYRNPLLMTSRFVHISGMICYCFMCRQYDAFSKEQGDGSERGVSAVTG